MPPIARLIWPLSSLAAVHFVFRRHQPTVAEDRLCSRHTMSPVAVERNEMSFGLENWFEKKPRKFKCSVLRFLFVVQFNTDHI